MNDINYAKKNQKNLNLGKIDKNKDLIIIFLFLMKIFY